MRAQLSAAVLGLLTTGLDAILTRQQELEYCWKRPIRMTLVRCLFFLARYLAIVIHVIFIALSSVMAAKFSQNQQVPESICTSSQLFQTLSCYAMLLILQVILTLRVFALYEESLWIGIFLSILLIGRLAWIVIFMLYIFGSSSPRRLKFSGPCLPVTDGLAMPSPVAVFILGELFVQFSLHGLLWKRTLWDFRHLSISGAALISVLNRDGVKVFSGFSVAMIAITFGALKIGVPSLFIFPQFISLLSVSGTRTILSLQMLQFESNEDGLRSQELELTPIQDSAIWDATTFLN